MSEKMISPLSFETLVGFIAGFVTGLGVYIILRRKQNQRGKTNG